MSYPFKIIVAYEKNSRKIGVYDETQSKMPWPILKADLRHFKAVTSTTQDPSKQNAVIMGRKTWETLPEKYRPLPGRRNIVISRNANYFDETTSDTRLFSDLASAIGWCHYDPAIETIFVIGGGQIYNMAINMSGLDQIYVTEVTVIGNEVKIPSKTVMTSVGIEVDLQNIVVEPEPEPEFVYFPKISTGKWHRQQIRALTESRKSECCNVAKQEYLKYRVNFIQYFPKKSIIDYDTIGIDYEYLTVLRSIMDDGLAKGDRTGTGTISTFGQTIRWNFKYLGDSKYTFPLVTTKRMFLKGVIKELLFFLRGDVDNDILMNDGVKIWAGNTTREFLDDRGLDHMEVGSLGKAYGFQWRHWGAEWQGKSHDYSTSPDRHDQIADILNLLKNNPNSRRIVLSAWNVSDLDEMCLPPCHLLYVFNVQNGKLYCHMTQRSADMFLGVPFNIASTALLVMILAKAAGLEPGGIMISFVDAHIYNTHIEQVKNQLLRTDTFAPPSMRINCDLDTIADIEALDYANFELNDYYYYPTIKASMAI